MKLKSLTKKESEIMTVFWNQDQPISLGMICEINPDLNRNTVQAVLKKLLSMKYIKVAKIGYSGTVLAREYVAAISHADYVYQTLSMDNIKKVIERFINNDASSEDITWIEDLCNKPRN